MHVRAGKTGWVKALQMHKGSFQYIIPVENQVRDEKSSKNAPIKRVNPIVEKSGLTPTAVLFPRIIRLN